MALWPAAAAPERPKAGWGLKFEVFTLLCGENASNLLQWWPAEDSMEDLVVLDYKILHRTAARPLAAAAATRSLQHLPGHGDYQFLQKFLAGDRGPLPPAGVCVGSLKRFSVLNYNYFRVPLAGRP